MCTARRRTALSLLGVLAFLIPVQPVTAGPGDAARGPTPEAAGPRGELRLTGRFIRRLTLQSRGGRIVVLEELGPTIQLPVDDYRVREVCLGPGNRCFTAAIDSRRWIRVVPDAPATLDVGGPLKPSIQVTRHGTRLEMVHLLEGQGGETYSAADSAERPRFTVTHAGRTIGSDRFEYG
jgi:hypothetical protein